MFGSTFTGEEEYPESLTDWEDRMGLNTENNVAAQAGDEPMRAALNAEIAMLRKALEYYADPKTNAPGAVARDALAASPRATADVERDAARYRWLREHGFGMPRLGAALDSSVDAAIATTKPGA